MYAKIATYRIAIVRHTFFLADEMLAETFQAKALSLVSICSMRTRWVPSFVELKQNQSSSSSTLWKLFRSFTAQFRRKGSENVEETVIFRHSIILFMNFVDALVATFWFRGPVLCERKRAKLSLTKFPANKFRLSKNLECQKNSRKHFGK